MSEERPVRRGRTLSKKVQRIADAWATQLEAMKAAGLEPPFTRDDMLNFRPAEGNAAIVAEWGDGQ